VDKIIKIKKICENILETSYGGEISIIDLIVIPTFRFDSEKETWTPDSYSIFLTLKKQNPDFFFEKNFGDFFESFLGFEFCVEFS
jgi:hypothetical protein